MEGRFGKERISGGIRHDVAEGVEQQGRFGAERIVGGIRPEVVEGIERFLRVRWAAGHGLDADAYQRRFTEASWIRAIASPT